MSSADSARSWSRRFAEMGRDAEWAEASRRLLEEDFTLVRTAIRDLFLEPRDEDALLVPSRETSTHIKYRLFGPTHDGPAIHLHHYFGHHGHSAKYANSYHNHRYAFSSMILAGRFTSETIGRAPHGADGLILMRDEPAIVTHEVGKVLSIDSEVVHRVREAEPGTLSIVLQGPVLESSSRVFDSDGRFLRSVTDLRGKVRETRTVASRALSSWSRP